MIFGFTRGSPIFRAPIGPMSSSHEIASSRRFYKTAAGIRFLRTTIKNFKYIVPRFHELDLIDDTGCHVGVIQSEVALLGESQLVLRNATAYCFV
jgi:hypothetical protein